MRTLTRAVTRATVALAAACGACSPEPPKPPDPVDDTTVDTPPAESRPADSGDASPPDGTVALPDPPAFGPGFTDISAPILADWDVPMQARDVALGLLPSLVQGLFAQLEPGAGMHVLISSRASGPARGQLRVYQYDLSARALRRDAATEAALSLGQGSVVRSAEDLDLDGRVDVLFGQADGARLRRDDGWEQASLIPMLQTNPPDFAGIYATADLDRDGWSDLLTARNLCGAPMLPALRTGARAFTLSTDRVAPFGGPTLSSDAVLWMPVERGDPMVALVGTPCDRAHLHPGWLVGAVRADSEGPFWYAEDRAAANSPWRLTPQHANQPMTSVMPMGSAVADLNGDGCHDVVHALSMPELIIQVGHCDGTYHDASLVAEVIFERQASTYDFPWGVAPLDLDRDGAEDLIVASGDDFTSNLYAEGRRFRPQAWWSAGDLRFVEVTLPVGLDGVRGNWQAISVDDIDADGDADLVVAALAMPVRVLRNDIETGNRGFSLRLVGHTSPADAAGAVVEVAAAGLPLQTRWPGYLANVGLRDRGVMFLATGPNAAADLTRIRWSSGYVQEVAGLSAGALHEVHEPPLVILDPPGRHVAADGVSRARVTLRPHHLDGTPDLTATAALRLDGPGTLSGPEVVDGAWTWTVVAPTTPAVTRVIPTLGGSELRVHPKLWWDAP